MFLQISFGPQNFPTKDASFSTCFFLCDSSNCLQPENFSHKSCTFFFMCFCMCFFKLPLVRNIFPQKLQFFLNVVFVYLSSNCLWSGKFSHKSCIFFYMCFLYVFLQIAFVLENFLAEIALKLFPTRVEIFS